MALKVCLTLHLGLALNGLPGGLMIAVWTSGHMAAFIGGGGAARYSFLAWCLIAFSKWIISSTAASIRVRVRVRVGVRV